MDSESCALFTGHSSYGAPFVFLSINHILCSALGLSAATKAMQAWRDCLIKVVMFLITLSISYWPYPEGLVGLFHIFFPSAPHQKYAEFHLGEKEDAQLRLHGGSGSWVLTAGKEISPAVKLYRTSIREFVSCVVCVIPMERAVAWREDVWREKM